jgi:hypothetical protein
MYGFVKIGRDASVREYQNENFIRGRPDLLLVIRRKSNPAAAQDTEDQQPSPTSSSSSMAAAATAVVVTESSLHWPRKAASDSVEDLRWRVRELERKYQDLATKHEALQDMLSAIHGGDHFASTLSAATAAAAPSSTANKTGRSLLDLVDAAIVSSERESGGEGGEEAARKRTKLN